MNDMFEMIATLKELQALYNTDELRNFDFETNIQKLERQVEEFEQDMQEGMYA